MKKIISTILALSMAVAMITPVMADDGISVTVNGSRVHFNDTEPFIENDRTLVPMRAIFEALGADVYWNDNTKTVYAYDDETGIDISLAIGDDYMTRMDSLIYLDVPAKIVGASTFIPLRAVAESMDCDVDWDGSTRKITINRKNGNPAIKSNIPSDNSVSIIAKAFQYDSASSDSPVVKELENYIGSALDFIWIPSSTYNEEIDEKIKKREFPDIMLIGSKSDTVIQATRNGEFWDITEKITDSHKFPNLAKSNVIVNHNISIDGRVYGVYRARELGRAGVAIRKDWLENLGLGIPKTIDDLYDVLYQFTYNDPDRNGQNDTYGMIVTDYLYGPLNNIAVWMGAPNGWGFDSQGELKPSFMFGEYTDALNFMRRCYSEGLINTDMETLSSNRWSEQFLYGYAGVIIDVADRARRISNNMIDPNTVDVFGYVKKNASSSPRVPATYGCDGYFAFPKDSVQNEEDLDYLLGIMDKMNDQEAQNLMNYGIEGRNYYIAPGGYAVKKDDASLLAEYADLTQVWTGIIPHKLQTESTHQVIASKVEEVYADNRKYVVENPAAPYIQSEYSQDVHSFDYIIEQAKVNFIVGKISEDEYNAEIERWLKAGGKKLISEVNEAYKKDTFYK